MQNQMQQTIITNPTFNGMPGHPMEYLQHSLPNHTAAAPPPVHHIGLPLQLPPTSQQQQQPIQPAINVPSPHDPTTSTNITSLPMNTQQQIALVQSNPHSIPIQSMSTAPTNPNSFVQQQQQSHSQQQQHFMSMASSSIGTYTQQQPTQAPSQQQHQQQQLTSFDGTNMNVEQTSSTTSSVYHTPTAPPNEQLISQLLDSANPNEFNFVGRSS